MEQGEISPTTLKLLSESKTLDEAKIVFEKKQLNSFLHLAAFFTSKLAEWIYRSPGPPNPPKIQFSHHEILKADDYYTASEVFQGEALKGFIKTIKTKDGLVLAVVVPTEMLRPGQFLALVVPENFQYKDEKAGEKIKALVPEFEDSYEGGANHWNYLVRENSSLLDPQDWEIKYNPLELQNSVANLNLTVTAAFHRPFFQRDFYRFIPKSFLGDPTHFATATEKLSPKQKKILLYQTNLSKNRSSEEKDCTPEEIECRIKFLTTFGRLMVYKR